MLDDVSPYDLEVYGTLGEPFAKTPVINNELKAKGILFDTAWSYATCSPTRSAMQTGHYGFRTGIGKEIGVANNGVGLPSTEIIIPKMLDIYAPEVWSHATIGKWHLSEVEYVVSPASKPSNAPDVLGYSFYRGQMFALTPGELYCKPVGQPWTAWDYWESSPGIDPVLAQATDSDILVTKHTQDAIDWIQTQASSPWILSLNYLAPYELHRAPEDNTYTTPIDFDQCESCAGTNSQKRDCFLAYMESTDFQIGRLLDAITLFYGEDWSLNTAVFLLADNGTPMSVTHPSVGAEQHKATPTEGALAIPFIVSGPIVPNTEWNEESPAMVHAVDIFATIFSFAGGDSYPGPIPPIANLDSLNLLPILSDPKLNDPNTPRRSFLFAEIFADNVGPNDLPVVTGTSNLRIARDSRYKYIFRTTNAGTLPSYYLSSNHRFGDEFYDLFVGEDPMIHNLNGADPIDDVVHPGGEAARAALLSSIQNLLGVQ